MITSKAKFLESFLGEGTKVSVNNDIAFYCPKCNHRKKKLAVNLTQNKSGHWGKYHCWVCGDDFKGKNLISLLRYVHRSDLISEYVSDIKDSKWLPFTDLESKPSINNEVHLPHKFVPISDYILGINNEKNLNYNLKRAYEYLASSRLLEDKHIITYLMGISTDRKYYGYILIPSFSLKGEINYFVGRSYTGHKFRYKNCKRKGF